MLSNFLRKSKLGKDLADQYLRKKKPGTFTFHTKNPENFYIKGLCAFFLKELKLILFNSVPSP